MIFIPSWTTQKHLKHFPGHSKLKKIQGIFNALHRNLRMKNFSFFSFKNEIQELYKDFSRLCEPCVVKELFLTVKNL